MAADDIRAVGQAERMLVVGRTQQQRGRIDGAARHHNDVSRKRELLTVALDMNHGYFTTGWTRFKPGDKCVGHQRDVWIFQRRVHAANLRVGLGVDEARMAVAGAATDAGTLARVLLIEHHAERRVKRPQTMPGKVVAQLLDARLMADGRIWKRRTAPRLGRIFTLRTVDEIKPFGLDVIRLQFIVGDWPRGRDAAVMTNLSKILFAQTEQRRAVKLGVAADVIICVRMQVLAVLVAPDFLRVVFALLVDRLGAPVVFLPRHVRAALNEQNSLTASGQPIRQRAAARAGANDDNIEVVSHGVDWSRIRRIPYKTFSPVRASGFLLRLTPGGDLHHVVEQRAVHVLEPVRHTARHDNDVTLRDAPVLAAFDLFPANFVGGDGLWLNHHTTGNERRRPLQ